MSRRVKLSCPQCGYAYTPRKATHCCPRCKTVMSKEEIRKQVIPLVVVYLLTVVIAYIVAMMSKPPYGM